MPLAVLLLHVAQMAAFGGSVDVMHQHGGQGVRVDAIF